MGLIINQSLFWSKNINALARIKVFLKMARRTNRHVAEESVSIHADFCGGDVFCLPVTRKKPAEKQHQPRRNTSREKKHPQKKTLAEKMPADIKKTNREKHQQIKAPERKNIIINFRCLDAGAHFWHSSRWVKIDAADMARRPWVMNSRLPTRLISISRSCQIAQEETARCDIATRGNSSVRKRPWPTFAMLATARTIEAALLEGARQRDLDFD